MKRLLLTTIAAVVLVGCGESQQSSTQAETKPVEPVAEATTPPKAVSANKGADPARGINPELPTAKAPDISIHEAIAAGNIEVVKQYLAAGVDVNAKGVDRETPLDFAIRFKNNETTDLLRKHGGKTGEELKAEGK